MTYYVYEWYVVETGEVFYVGKGCGNRWKVTQHNSSFKTMIKTQQCKSRIIKYFNTEQEAFEYEHMYIEQMWNKGLCKCNISHGGYGGSTEWWTPEIRKQYSIGNVMKNSAQRQRMSENNPMKDPEVAALSGNKHKRSVIIGNTEYDSVKAVQDKYHVSISTVETWCRNGMTSEGMICHYKNEIVTPIIYHNTGQKKKLTYLGKHYESATELAKNLGISSGTVARWCRSGYDSQGNLCRYDDDNREFLSKPKNRSTPIIINGIHYNSKSDASRILGITTYEITTYLEGKQFNEHYICEYDNQQPSQMKSGNSNLEGSTTNG